MGQKFSLNTFTPDVLVYIEKYFPKYNIIKLLNNGMLYKTVLISTDKDNNPLILKLFFKNNYNDKDKAIFSEEYNKMCEIQEKIFKKQINNICPIIKMEDNPPDINSVNRPVGMIFRQYTEYNLQERIYLMPYLRNIEKIWIAFQILYCLNDLKNMKIIHGDLKPENILLTSNLSVYICDFGTYKPAYVSIDDIADYTYYFGTNSTDSMKGCYLAPERLVEKNIINNNEKTYQMDVFSAGVIIAELFLERNIFDYTGLLDYKKGNKNRFNIDEILNKIPQNNIRSLIYKMIAINPEDRIDISEALKIFSNEICPIAIPGFIFHFNSIITSTQFWKPDYIIGHIYRYWGTIWKIIFGINENPIPLNQTLNFYIINKILLEDPFFYFGENSIFVKNSENYLCIGDFELIFQPENGEIYEKYLKRCENIENKNCLYLILDYLLEASQYTKYDTSNLLALEMIYILSKKLSDVAKLQLTLPYFINNLKRKKYIIQVTSINYIFDILYSINYEELVLPTTEYNYFGAYVFPALLNFYKKENPYIILEFFNNVDKIIDLEQKFLNVTLKTRLKKNKENMQNIKYKNENKIKEEKEEENISLGSSKNLGINDNYDDNVRLSVFSYQRESTLKPNKDRTFEIFNDYDSNIESFKSSLFSITGDLIGRNNEIDILITVIRKLPSLLLFYGKSKTNDFSKFIINNFNKLDWIVQQEILTQIPQMTITIGEKPLNDYILPCMEMLISNNSNELKLLELIKSINQLLKMDYLSQDNAIDFFKKLLPFILHPNISIKHEIINFCETMFNYLSPDEIFCYLYEPLQSFLLIPPVIINKSTIINHCKQPIPRFLYQLELENINYNISKLLPDEKYRNDKKIGINNLELLKDLIESQKAGNLNTDDNGDINYLYDQNQFKNQTEEYKKYSLLDPLDKYIKKEINSMQGFSDKGLALETKIFGKIFYLGNDKEKLKFVNFKDNSKISFENNNSMISSDLFRISYVLKTLGISLKMIMLEELLNYKESDELETIDKKTKLSKKSENILPNFHYNKLYNNWRPKGQIISTLYDHKTLPVEKLLLLDSSNFCSFDNLGNAILYNVRLSKDNEIIINKKWEYFTDNKEEIKYKNNISSIDNSYFAVALKNKLYQYNPHISSKSKEVCLFMCESKDNSDITCIKPFGYLSKENQKILFCTENGFINIYDNRTSHEISLKLEIPKEKGIMNCICESFDYGQFLISTLDGNLLKYDIRLNSLINEFKYCYGAPISGISTYNPSKLNEYEFGCFNKNSQYVILWSGGQEHEISFFNVSDMNCDLLLKLNIQNNSNELTPLEIDIPYFENINEDENDMKETELDKISKKFKYLEKFTYVYNTNKIKRFFKVYREQNYYEVVDQRIKNLSDIYNSPNTVQCVLSPFSDFSFSKDNNIYENTPFIISAGNDKVIRYWDISKDMINNNNLNKSYIINAPNNLNSCQFIKGNFDRTNIIQSNENYNFKGVKSNIPGFSEFQNFNGILYHTSVQNEFNEEDNDLKYCTKISDPAHKGIITDLLPININGRYEFSNLLISSSLDGTVKIWK